MPKQNSTGAKQTGEKDGEKIPQKSPSRGKTPKEIVDNHIRNKEDVISEEEFKNVDLDLDTNNDVKHEPLVIREGKKRPKDGDKDNPITTPWDVISE